MPTLDANLLLETFSKKPLKTPEALDKFGDSQLRVIDYIEQATLLPLVSETPFKALRFCRLTAPKLKNSTIGTGDARALASLVVGGWVSVTQIEEPFSLPGVVIVYPSNRLKWEDRHWILRLSTKYVIARHEKNETDRIAAEHYVAVGKMLSGEPEDVGSSVDSRDATARKITQVSKFKTSIGDPSRWGMSGVLWEKLDETASVLVATNGHILFRARLDFPVVAAPDLLDVLGGSKTPLPWSKAEISSELLEGAPRREGDFPDYHQILPLWSGNFVKATIDPRAVIQAFKGRGSIAADTTASFFDGRRFVFRSRDREFSVSLDLEWDGDNLGTRPGRVGFSARNLLKILRFMDSGAPVELQCHLDRHGEFVELKPLELRQSDENGIVRQAILMPMRLD